MFIVNYSLIVIEKRIKKLDDSLISKIAAGEVLDMVDSENIYYTFAERTDKYKGVSIFFEGNEVPVVTLKRYGRTEKMLLSPQIYALNIICMADKMGIELTKDLLESKLEKFAHDSSKHWSSLLEVDGCVIYDNGKLLPGQKLRDVVDLANTYLGGMNESFEKPIQIKYVSYPRIRTILAHKDGSSISGDQAVLDTGDCVLDNSPVQFSDSRLIDKFMNNKPGKFIVSVDEYGGISHIASDNGNLTIIYSSPDGSVADEESLPVKKLQINGNFTPAGNSIRMGNGNSADSIVDVLSEFGLLDDGGNLNEHGEELSEKIGVDWNSILSSE